MEEFVHPFTCVVSGPTGAGKTELIKNIIVNSKHIIDLPPEKIIWFYAERQPQLEFALPNVEFRNEMPNLDEFNGMLRVLIVIDDFMSEANAEITKLFSKGSHHRNLSIFFLVQNFFHGNKQMRTITLNAHYIILFKNPRDQSQIYTIARQMFPNNSKFLMSAFKIATESPFGYLFLDLKQKTPEEIRVRTQILPNEPTFVFRPK
jgi:hypothetical protein